MDRIRREMNEHFILSMHDEYLACSFLELNLRKKYTLE